jgi:hypothetical protein
MGKKITSLNATFQEEKNKTLYVLAARHLKYITVSLNENIVLKSITWFSFDHLNMEKVVLQLSHFDQFYTLLSFPEQHGITNNFVR